MSRVPQLGSLRAELTAAGTFNHHELRSWAKIAVLLGAVAACFYGIYLKGWVAALLLVPVASVFATAFAMTGHEGSHRSFSASPMRNAILTHLAFPIFSGLSALYWREKHDRLHHGNPNVEGVDPDIRPWPFVSSKGDHEKMPKRLQWFQRNFQAWAFWPMTTLMAAGMRRSSLIFLWNYRKRNGYDRGFWIEFGCQVAHYAGWLLIPSLVFGPLVALLIYSSVWAGVGVCLVLVFAPAHIGLPVMAVQNNDWLHQLETTRNLEMPGFISYFFIGLDYQVEHHVFPKIPHQNLPRASAIMRDWCARNGVVHLSVPYLEALVDAGKFMARSYERDATAPMAVRVGLIEDFHHAQPAPSSSVQLAA